MEEPRKVLQAYSCETSQLCIKLDEQTQSHEEYWWTMLRNLSNDEKSFKIRSRILLAAFRGEVPKPPLR